MATEYLPVSEHRPHEDATAYLLNGEIVYGAGPRSTWRVLAELNRRWLAAWHGKRLGHVWVADVRELQPA
jgi:hypothetical protein